MKQDCNNMKGEKKNKLENYGNIDIFFFAEARVNRIMYKFVTIIRQ